MKRLTLCALALLAAPVCAETPASREEIAAVYALEIAPLDPLPPAVIETFAAVEDPLFRQRALAVSPLTRTAVQILHMPGGVLQRFADQTMVAAALDHDRIATLVAQRVYLGLGCYGARDAALAYFGRAPEGLTLPEIAFLAGLIRGPALYHPLRAPDRALARRDEALGHMVEAGLITRAQAEEAAQAPLTHQVPLGSCGS